MTGQASKKEKSFEAALQRLEEIVSEMEAGELSLDVMLKKFDEGIRLAQFCSRKLEEAEKKIEILLKKEDGSIETREFLPSQQPGADSGEPADRPTPLEQEINEQEEEHEEPLF